MTTNAGVYLILYSWHAKTEKMYLVKKLFFNQILSPSHLAVPLSFLGQPHAHIVKPLSHFFLVDTLR